MHKLASYGALLALIAFAAVAQAPRPARGGLQLSSTLEPVAAKAADGDDAPPAGAEFVLSVEFTNTSEHVLDAVRITSPVPRHLRYVVDSASGPGSEAMFSVDEGQTFGQPADLTIVGADGRARAAEAAEYTHVRFVLDAPLDAGATGIARFRVVSR
jgi:hypothetical protein